MIAAIQRNVTWRAIPIAAFAAGTVYLLVNLFLMPAVFQLDPALLLRYQAALVMGEGVLVDSGGGVILVGLLVHYLLALLLTLVIAIVVHRWGLLIGVIGGAILGLAFYGINLYTMTLFFPWYYAIHNNVLLLSHVLFGAVAGGVYESLDRFDVPLEKDLNHDPV